MLELPNSLLEELEAGGTLVAPSRQRAAVIRLAYAAARLRRQEKLWRTPDVVAFNPWLEREVLRRVETAEACVLRGSEEWLLWRQAVAQVMTEADLAPNDALVETLRRSARLLFDWRIPVDTVDRIGDDESLLLVRSILWVEERCAQIHAIPAHRLIERLLTSVPRAPVTFAGFSECSAARAALMDRWNTRGLQAREHQAQGGAGAAQIVRALDAGDELSSAAAWCRDQLEQDPARRLLVVIPDLAQRRHGVSQAFQQALAPQIVLGQASESGAARFAIEGGQALSTYPLVRQALASLRFLCGKLDFARWSAWLRSSFWASPPAAGRARLEAYLRLKLDIESGAPELLAALQAMPGDLELIVSPLRSAVTNAARILDGQSESASASAWSRRFGGALRALGWPGVRALSSDEQQTHARFQELLAELAVVAPHTGALRAIDAVVLLEELATRSAFEPATGDPAVTISGAIGDPIVKYDGIWVTGLHADAWPRPVSIDPFIPLAAQRQAGIPNASPVRALEHGRALLQTWRRCANQLVVSWPRQDGERAYLASPLLDELQQPRVGVARQFELAFDAADSAVAAQDSWPVTTLAQRIRSARKIECFEDAQGDPWPAHKPVPAGTRTLEYQNRCPVRAYAELRLGAVPLETPRPGVDFRERGTLLHRALELLWSRLGGSRELHESFGPRLDALIEESVARAMADAFGTGGVYRQQRFMLREHRRVVRLIRELCALERQRPPFRAHDLEARRTWVSQSGCSLDLRIDRIDELEDGTHVIFDYKSGAPQTHDWLGERVTHPQLLVYMLSLGVDVSALATVQLSPGRVGFKGIADRKGRLPRVTGLESASRWPEQQERWRQAIERLAADFLAGAAPLDPLANACRTCHLHAFCRIADTLQDDFGVDE